MTGLEWLGVALLMLLWSVIAMRWAQERRDEIERRAIARDVEVRRHVALLEVGAWMRRGE